MRNILILIVLFLTAEAQAICNTPISRLNINPGQIPYSSKYNQDFNNLYEKANELSGDCIADSTVQTAQIENGAITTDKISNSSVTFSKFDPAAAPLYRKPLRIRAYSSGAMWQKNSDVGSVFVQLVGGGGGSKHPGVSAASAGTASSFGSYCVANGGGASTSGSVGSGGTATNGDINLTGGAGKVYSSKSNCYSIFNPDTNNFDQVPCAYGGFGGASVLGNFGQGGQSFSNGYAGHGGGAGGYCARLLVRSELSDEVVVTVGSGGTSPKIYPLDKTPRNGGAGIVIVYEFAQQE